MERLVDGLNVAWFGAATATFVLGARGFTRRNLLRGAPSPGALTEVAVYTMRFLGGMNAGWLVLFLFKLLGKQGQLGEAAAVQYLAAAVAHFSQWLFNLQLATGTAPQHLQVRFSKEMLFIFVTDLSMALLNLRQGLLHTPRHPDEQKRSTDCEKRPLHESRDAALSGHRKEIRTLQTEGTLTKLWPIGLKR